MCIPSAGDISAGSVPLKNDNSIDRSICQLQGNHAEHDQEE